MLVSSALLAASAQAGSLVSGTLLPFPPSFAAPALTLPLQAEPLPASLPGSALVIARHGDTGQQIADAYGVDVSALSPERTGTLPEGAVLRVSFAELPGSAAGVLPPGVSTYLVQSGDTLESIAAAHDLSVTELLSANLHLETLNKLAVGASLFVPQAQVGLLVRIKAGQSVQSLVRTYHADPAQVALANGFGLPNERQVGDYLLLPGVMATGFRQQLVARQERQEEVDRQARVQQQYERFQAYRVQVAQERQRATQAQYERYLVWQKQVQQQRLAKQQAIQTQYQNYLAWQHSEARQKLIEKYAAQAQFEAAQQAARVQAQALARAQAKSRQLNTVRAASTAQSQSAQDLSWPLRSFRVTSRFGERDIEFHKEFFHGGVDLAAPYGTPIYAAAGGTVTRSGYGDFGNNVYVENGNAVIIYGHMSRLGVSAGQTVQRGQLLGYVGCSGICTGPHLHFEVRLNGQAVDPLGLLP
ncbi:peptidoglycan DD-metalloendopeptidase family protein [Deinococcus sp. KNUC1210]|uniref:peptidoglycan DD-metalloendopeptidase family protein n=1 Tax=Deinococcus sp. KNUC1210 TaxID=2917691 RepID=UPI001EEF8E89|nr:peptidoglycan DD-metalloendopeptidase family protein [Deinococcus sp. KNUC1210]ULH16131.1 peptidoglycan DD-metalloendopeptidase family protein [Deinococcus sp. KNUC1210]